MLNFMMNDKIYENQANNQLAVILSQFDSGYVMDIVEDTLNINMNQFSTVARPNAVISFETTYKSLLNIYPFEEDNINQSRIETYQTIINFICQKFGLKFVQPNDMDIYTVAMYMYDFFVSKLDQYLVKFYAEYINKEKSNIFYNMNLASKMADKNISNVYNSVVFDEDKELIAVATNLPDVLRQLAMTTIPDYEIYRTIYVGMEEILPVFEECIVSTTPIFGIYNKILFNENLYGIVLTEIRLLLQKSINLDRVNQMIRKDA